MIACCGLNCSKCDAYLATKIDSDNKRQDTAKKWSSMYNADIKPEHIKCEGCRSNGDKFFHCDVCGIRRCCLSTGVDNCAACEEYICDTLSGFIKSAPEAGIALEKLRHQ